MIGLSPGAMVCSVPGEVRVAPLVSEVRVMAQLPDTSRTQPYSFRDLMDRWECSMDTVESVVGGRGFKIGRSRFVRPSVVMQIERERGAE